MLSERAEAVSEKPPYLITVARNVRWRGGSLKEYLKQIKSFRV